MTRCDVVCNQKGGNMTFDHLFIGTLIAMQSLGTMYALVLLIRGVHDIGEMLERVAKALGQSKQ